MSASDAKNMFGQLLELARSEPLQFRGQIRRR
jgi:hypothetical protein